MIGVFAGAMMTIMALVVFGSVIPLGGVNPILLTPSFCLVLLMAALWAGRLLFDSNTKWSWSLTHWAVLAFVAYSVARYFTSPFEYEARNELFQVTLCALVFLVAAHQFRHRKDRVLFVWVLAVLAVFQSAMGMWQGFTYSDAIFHWERPDNYNGRGSGTFVCPNHLAGFLELALGLLVARIALVRRESQSTEKSIILKVLLVYAALMTIAGILFSYSRSGWMATMVGLVAFGLLGEWRLRVGLQRAALVIGLLSFMGLVLWNVTPVRDYIIKTFAGSDPSKAISLRDPSLGGRVLMWTGTVRMIQDEPVFGTGIGSWQWIYQGYKKPGVTVAEPDYTHNDYLNLAADYGLVGAVIMLAVFAGFFRHAWRVSRNAQSSEQRAFAVGAMISVIAILFHSWFDFNLHIPANSLILAAIMGFTVAIGDRPEPASDSPAHPIARFAVAGLILGGCGMVTWPFVHTFLGFHYTDLGNGAKTQLDNETAFAYYARASEWDAHYPKPHIRTGDIHLSLANWRRGPAKAAERRSLAKKAVDAYEQALRLNPHMAYVRVSLAYAYELAGQDEEALKNYQAAIKTSPINAYAHYKLGCYHRDRGQEQEAADAFAKANEYFNYTDETFNLNDWEARERRGKAQPK